MKVGIVACSKTKRYSHGLTEARHLYTSPLFRFSAAYVRRACDHWCILSAKHGLVMPWQRLLHYEQSLYDLTPQQRQEWAERTQRQLLATYYFNQRPGSEVIVLAGKLYQAAIPEQWNVTTPLEGMGIGQRVAWLKQQLEEGVE